MSTNAANSTQGPLVSDFTLGVATRKPGEGVRKPGNDLDKDAFLKLLLVQLQYQDPLNPMEDREFIAQMAQFSALEQMQNMNNAYARSQAYDMIGRDVAGLSFSEASNTYNWVEGIVTGVTFKGGEPVLEVKTHDGKIMDLELKRVEHVGEDVSRLHLMQSMNTNIANQQYMMLIDQYVQAVTVDESGRPNGYIEGKVSSIRFGAAGTTLVVGNREISPGEVISVGPANSIYGKTVSASLPVIVDGRVTDHRAVKGTIMDIRINGEQMFMVFREEKANDKGVHETHNVHFTPLDGLVRAINMHERGAIVTGTEGTGTSAVHFEGKVTGVLLIGGLVQVMVDVQNANGTTSTRTVPWNNVRETSSGYNPDEKTS